MYSFKHEPETGILRISMNGFWTVATVDGLVSDLRPVIDQIKVSGKPLLLLGDMRDFAVQSREVAERFARFDEIFGLRPDRLAIISTSTLVKLQGERVDAGGAHFYSTISEAEEWLLQSRSR
jgi:hypothetical protein